MPNASDSAPASDTAKATQDISSEELAIASQVIEFLRSKWAEGANCPYCGASDWLVDPRPRRQPVDGYVVVCQNCGVSVITAIQVNEIEPNS